MRVRFGEFTLDTQTRQLCQGETPRHVSPKAFELLRLLLDRRPSVVSKAELHERLWPSTFVSDATLTSLVAELRRALGEKARRGRFVRTVYRVGYAFDGAVSELPTRTPGGHCWLIWEYGQVALANGAHLLGRDRDVGVWLESPSVSRRHALISVVGADATIEDLGSKNGTFLRGARLTGQSPLIDGDDIRLGSVPLRFRLVETTGSTETERSR